MGAGRRVISLLYSISGFLANSKYRFSLYDEIYMPKISIHLFYSVYLFLAVIFFSLVPCFFNSFTLYFPLLSLFVSSELFFSLISFTPFLFSFSFVFDNIIFLFSYLPSILPLPLTFILIFVPFFPLLSPYIFSVLLFSLFLLPFHYESIFYSGICTKSFNPVAVPFQVDLSSPSYIRLWHSRDSRNYFCNPQFAICIIH